MSLLSIIQKVAPRLGLRRPSAVVGSTDLTAQMLLELANEEGDELSRFHDWQALVTERNFTTLAQVAQTNALISTDYDRLPHNVEFWNRTLNLRYAGPTPQRVWQQLQSGVAAGVVGWWRIMGGQLQIYPAPTADQSLVFEYISKNWCASATGTPQSEFLADADVARIPERLMQLGIRWRWKQARGFDYAEDLETYEREREKAAVADRGTGRIRNGNSDLANLTSPNWTGTLLP
jgi:hypothetical protein